MNILQYFSLSYYMYVMNLEDTQRRVAPCLWVPYMKTGSQQNTGI